MKSKQILYIQNWGRRRNMTAKGNENYYARTVYKLTKHEKFR